MDRIDGGEYSGERGGAQGEGQIGGLIRIPRGKVKEEAMRCSICGYRIGGKNHEGGDHHRKKRGLTKAQRKAEAKHGVKTSRLELGKR